MPPRRQPLLRADTPAAAWKQAAEQHRQHAAAPANAAALATWQEAPQLLLQLNWAATLVQPSGPALSGRSMV